MITILAFDNYCLSDTDATQKLINFFALPLLFDCCFHGLDVYMGWCAVGGGL